MSPVAIAVVVAVVPWPSRSSHALLFATPYQKKKRKKEKKIIRPRINNDGDCWPVVNKIDRPVAGVSLLFCFCFCFLSFMLKADRVH